MSEEKPAGVKSTIGGWIKAGVTSIVGLASGAFIMYLTPVVNNAIKPARPVANFATQATGLAVEFNNRSTGGIQGWWDFGDGSALEPFDPKSDIVKHAYAKPGSYNVKLTLANLIGEESDRTAPVALDPGSLPKPEIALFKLIPLDPRERAPCTYRLVSQVKNASFSILSVGDNRPMEVIEDPVNHERYVTYNEMGAFTVRLAAVNGKQLVEQTETIYVGGNDVGDTLAKLLVTYDVVKVAHHERTWRMYCTWPADAKDNAAPFRKEHIAEQGYVIVKAELVNKDEPNAPRKLKLEIAPDKKKVILTGEMMKPTGASTLPSSALVKVELESQATPQKIDRGGVTMAVNLNSAMEIPMQPLEPGWQVVRKQVSLQLWDGGRKVWEGSQAVASVPVILRGQTCYVTVTPQSDSMVLRVDAAPVGPTIRPVSLERYPLKK
jgi:PKD repeat protein